MMQRALASLVCCGCVLATAVTRHAADDALRWASMDSSAHTDPLEWLPSDDDERLPPLHFEDPAFRASLRRNIAEHEMESEAECEHFHCGPARADSQLPERDGFDVHKMGPVPSLDFPDSFGNEDGQGQIFVSRTPLFDAHECRRIIELAELEGEGLPTAKSGKYQIGKAWIKDMPQVLEWFNEALATKLFPSLSQLFPQLLPDSSTLRAHSVAILKYNASHPRTDVHVDDALFAFTIALSPSDAFEGGGTYFEHLDAVVEMEQGHVTFRPGAVRHAGAAVTSGLRYVVGGFIAVANKVEHVRRLNERGSRILIDSPNAVQLREAERQFQWALALNPNCSLCYQNLGDTYLRLEQPAQAEAALRQQIALLPRDSDAYFALGNALRGQDRADEARLAYESAVRITPTDHESHLGLASALGSLGRTSEQVDAYRKALQVRPTDVATWINLGVALSAGEDTEAETEAAFRSGVEVGSNDARAPLNLGRYLAKLSRPAEAIHYFDAAASMDAEYAAEAKLGVGTARAQQGRLREATAHFMSASAMRPADAKLQEAIGEMEQKAEQIERNRAAEDAVAEVCGTPCQDIIDSVGTAICASSWTEGCGDAEPPSGFHGGSTVAELCPRACAYYLDQRVAT